MKKGEVILAVTIGLVCFVLACVMFMQFKTVEETNITEIETLTEAELREKLASWRTRYEDKPDVQEIEARDLLLLINELRLAGAEAISINDQRIINMSDIVDIDMADGASFILVNKKKRIVSPYVIKAIGDQKYLESALTTKTVGFMDQYIDVATLEKQNNIRIEKYSYDIDIQYANVKEEEN